MRPLYRVWVVWGGYSGCVRKSVGTLLLIAAGLSISIADLRSEEPSRRSAISRWLKLPPKSAAPQDLESPPPASRRVRVTANRDPIRAPAAVGKAPAGTARVTPVSQIQRVALQASPSDPAAVIPAAPGASQNGNSIPVPPPADNPAGVPAQVSLNELEALADSNHPRLTTAFQRIQAAEGRAIQAGLYPNPVVAGSSPQIDGNESQYNGFVSQEFVLGGKLKLSRAAAQQEIEQARYAWQQERFLVITDLRQKFFATLAAQQRVGILERMVHIAERSRDTAQKLLEAGEGTRGDVLLLDVELRRAEVALRNARTIYSIGKRQLALLVAVPDYMIDGLAGDLVAATRDYDLEEIRYAVASVNPRANISRLEIDRTALLLQRAVVEPVPNIDIMGGYQRQVGVPAQNQGLFQVSLTIPLWNRNQGNILSAQADHAGARAELQRVELELGNLAADALTNYQTARQLVEQYETEMLPKARESLKLSQDLYEQGQIDFLRLLQSQKTQLDAELATIDAQEQRWVSAAAIAGLLQEDAFP